MYTKPAGANTLRNTFNTIYIWSCWREGPQKRTGKFTVTWSPVLNKARRGVRVSGFWPKEEERAGPLLKCLARRRCFIIIQCNRVNRSESWSSWRAEWTKAQQYVLNVELHGRVLNASGGRRIRIQPNTRLKMYYLQRSLNFDSLICAPSSSSVLLLVKIFPSPPPTPIHS